MSVHAYTLLHQLERPVGQFDQVLVGAVAIGKNRKTEFFLPVALEESRVTGDAAAMSKVQVAAARLDPPGQAESGFLAAPQTLDRSFKFLKLQGLHLR